MTGAHSRAAFGAESKDSHLRASALQARGLGKHYRGHWALSDRTLDVPAGHIVGLVGPNGAGKTALLRLAVGMITPTTGTIQVLGGHPGSSPHQLRKVGFVAQGTPTYPGLSVADHLKLGEKLNPGWDAPLAWDRVDEIGLDPKQRAGKLSGGQRAQLALTLALAKRPELLILDEPVASLDPLARREFLQDLMGHVADNDSSVVLSSHLVADLERSCDYLIVLCTSRVRLAGEVEHLLATHLRLTGPKRDPDTLPVYLQVITASHTERQSTLIVRSEAPVHDPAWTVEHITLEDLVLAYMSEAGVSRRKAAEAGDAVVIWLTWRQFRTQSIVTLAALAATALILALTGPHLAHLFHTEIAGCLGQTGANACSSQTLSTFANTDSSLQHFFGFALIVIPALIGAFWGAPLLSREVEAGTHQLVWNQSITRTRWLAVKIGLIGLASAVAAGLSSLMLTWWSSPIDQVNANRITPPVFDQRGIDPLGWALFAFALGLTAGVLLRRTLPAMATTIAAFTATRILWPLYLRAHLIPPVHETAPVATLPYGWVGVNSGPNSPMLVHVSKPGAWVLSDHTVNAAGHQISGGALFSLCPVTTIDGVTKTPPDNCFIQHLVQLGYNRSVLSYQPGSRFWALQGVETGILTALAVLLAGLCYWWVHQGKAS